MNRRAIVTLIVILAILGGVWALTSYQRARKTQELLTKLASPDEFEAMDAMQQLRSRGRSIAPRLVEHLESSHPRVRWRAALLLSEIRPRDPEVATKLVAMCSDPEVVVRKAAMIACGRLGLTDATAAIVTVISDVKAPPDLRATAAAAAGLLKDPKAVKALARLLKEHPLVKPKQEEKSEVEGQGGEDAEAAAQSTSDKSAEAEAEEQEEEQPDELWQARMEAAWALGEIGTSEAVDALAEAVKDELEPNVAVRTAAAHALADAVSSPQGQGARVKAIRAMLDALGDEAGDVRIAAAMSLARTYPPKSVAMDVAKALRAHVDDEHYWVRLAVKYAMDQLRISAEG